MCKSTIKFQKMQQTRCCTMQTLNSFTWRVKCEITCASWIKQ